MKVEVDVDLNRINYDKIEEAVMKRIDSEDLSKILELGYCTKERIEAITKRNIDEKLDKAITRYTNASPDKELDEIINATIKDVIKEVCMDRIKAVIEQIGGEEKIEEITHSLLGDMFAAAFYDHMQQIVFSASATYGERQSERCRNEAKDMIERAFYESGHAVPNI